jgi:hypothetical protein
MSPNASRSWTLRASLVQMNPAGLAMIEADSLAEVQGQTGAGRGRTRSTSPAFADLHQRVLAGESGGAGV